MAAPTALQLALDLALGERDAVAQKLLQARQAWMAAQMQLDHLESYAQEAGERWRRQSTRCSAELMRHHYQFMERLTHAIQLQTAVVAEHGRTLDSRAEALRQAEARLEALRQVQATRERERRLLLQRSEQKLADEQAAMLYGRMARAAAGEP